MEHDVLMEQFDFITKKLKQSGADLSKIKIVMDRGSQATYITKRIMMEMEERNT